MDYDNEELDPKEDDAILRLARKRLQHSSEADTEDREEAKDDLRFLRGRAEDQWEQSVKNEREASDRPCLTINQLSIFHDQIIGDQRQNRPAITVRAVDSDGDPETAKVLTGLIRNIENISDAEVAYDHAFEMSSGCGRGNFRIITDYLDDDSFDQHILIKRIGNPFSVYLGPHNEVDGSDAPYGFICEKMSIEEFKAQWPGVTPRDLDDPDEDLSAWSDKDQVIVAEYFYKKPNKQTLYLLADGTTTRDKPKKDSDIVKSRPINSFDIKWCKTDGYQMLEEPTDWPGRYIPIIPVWGKELVIDGVRCTRGCIRHAKDAQRLYNYFRSTDAETVALQPRVPYLLTPKMIGGYQTMWDKAHKANLPYLLFNPDPTMPGLKPFRELPPVTSQGHVEQLMLARSDLQQTIGIFDAGLGKKSNETSGIAIRARQRESDVGAFAYTDNLSRSMRHAGRILLDLIPRIYDTKRVVRIFNEDETERFVTINAPGEDEKGEPTLYDLSVGRYDVTVTTGPSYSTQREEAAASMMEFIKAVPPAAPIIQDLVAKNMDWPGAAEISDRLKKVLPPGIAEPEEGEELMAEPMVEPPPPDPVMETKLAIEQEKLKQQQLETEQKEIELSIKRLELEEKAEMPQEQAA